MYKPLASNQEVGLITVIYVQLFIFVLVILCFNKRMKHDDWQVSAARNRVGWVSGGTSIQWLHCWVRLWLWMMSPEKMDTFISRILPSSSIFTYVNGWSYFKRLFLQLWHESISFHYFLIDHFFLSWTQGWQVVNNHNLNSHRGSITPYYLMCLNSFTHLHVIEDAMQSKCWTFSGNLNANAGYKGQGPYFSFKRLHVYLLEFWIGCQKDRSTFYSKMVMDSYSCGFKWMKKDW